MASLLKNIVVIGGSYVGRGTAEKLTKIVPSTHRILLIESHTHFHHLFTFPRFALVPGWEHKAFIPYSNTLATRGQSEDAHAVIQARVLSVQSKSLLLDREWQGSNQIDFDYLVVATGSALTAPSGLPFDKKSQAVDYLRKHQDRVKSAKSILIAGGGAAGVQMATDLKEKFPEKSVTLVHSREHLMPKFNPKLHEIIKGRFEELGVGLVTGARVVVPIGGFNSTESTQRVEFTNGDSTTADFVILTTGQIANNALLTRLDSQNENTILNPNNGMIRVRPTLQFSNPLFDHCFAVGDIADTGAHKAARPGAVQADVVVANIQALLENRLPEQQYIVAPAAIHITLGFNYNIIFRNPNLSEGQTEPTVIEKDDGREDMNVEAMWERLGIKVSSPNEYHL